MELDFTLEEGAVINVNLPAVKTEFTAVYYGGVKSVPTNFVDKGAKWNITTASATTLNLPLVFDNDGNPKEWKLNSATIASTSKTTAGAANVYTNESTTLANHSEIKGYTELYGNGRKYFTSLQTAVNDLGSLYYYTGAATDDALWTAAGTPTIYVVNDFTSASEILPSWYLAYGNNAYSAAKVPTVIIKGVGADGSRVKITTTNEGSFIGGNAYYNLTLEDIDLECTNGFALFWRGYNTKVITVNEENVTVGQNSGKSTTNMINCNIKATGTKVATGKLNEGLVFKVTGNKNQTKTENYIINMIGTNVETTFETNETVDTGVNAVFLFHHGAAGELNIDGNSSIIHNQNRAGA